jgi:hypothetical protein
MGPLFRARRQLEPGDEGSSGGATTGGGGTEGGTLVFASAADPVALDGILVSALVPTWITAS